MFLCYNDFTKFQKCIDAARQINAGMVQAASIDNYIDHLNNEDIQFCGKVAIVRAILEAEKNSMLFIGNSNINNTLSFNSLENTWFHKFFQLLTIQRRKNDLDKLFDNVSFINFNYDRCLEQYLLYALKNFSHIQEHEAAQLIKTLEIIHPYGHIGTLPWLSMQNECSSAFGAEAMRIEGGKFISISTQIKTFTEQTHDQKILTRIHEAISNAKKIVFLGFSFNAENMQLLYPHKSCSADKIFATFKGVSEGDTDAVKQLICKTLGYDKQTSKLINIYSLRDKCYELFNYYERSIAN